MLIFSFQAKLFMAMKVLLFIAFIFSLLAILAYLFPLKPPTERNVLSYVFLAGSLICCSVVRFNVTSVQKIIIADHISCLPRPATLFDSFRSH